MPSGGVGGPVRRYGWAASKTADVNWGGGGVRHHQYAESGRWISQEVQPMVYFRLSSAFSLSLNFDLSNLL